MRTLKFTISGGEREELKKAWHARRGRWGRAVWYKYEQNTPPFQNMARFNEVVLEGHHNHPAQCSGFQCSVSSVHVRVRSPGRRRVARVVVAPRVAVDRRPLRRAPPQHIIHGEGVQPPLAGLPRLRHRQLRPRRRPAALADRPARLRVLARARDAAAHVRAVPPGAVPRAALADRAQGDDLAVARAVGRRGSRGKKSV